MTWSYQENDCMYIINGTCMQIYKWNCISKTYDIKNMISYQMALHRYPDILKKYEESKDTHTSLPCSTMEDSLINKLNTLHINRAP